MIKALVGIGLFVFGGMVLSDSFGDDWLTFVGLLAGAAGLFGIISGGVESGMRSAER